MAIINPVSFLHNRTDHTGQTDRLAQSGLLMPEGNGVTWRTGTRGANDLKVTAQGSPNMTVNVAAGQIYVPQSSAVQGAYLATNDGIEVLTITPAHATLARRDLVILRVIDSFFGDSDSAGYLEVVSGNASSSPSDPVIVGNYKLLARVTVAASTLTITGGAITDLRTRTVALGGILPVATTAERNLLNLANRPVVDNAETGFIERYNGTAWKQLQEVEDRRKYQQTGGFSVTLVANVTKSIAIDFDVTMNSSPRVIPVPHSPTNAIVGMHYWITGETTSGFTFSIQREGPATIDVGWSAVCE